MTLFQCQKCDCPPAMHPWCFCDRGCTGDTEYRRAQDLLPELTEAIIAATTKRARTTREWLMDRENTEKADLAAAARTELSDLFRHLAEATAQWLERS